MGHPKFVLAVLAFLLVGPAAAQVSEPDLDDIPAKMVKSTSNYDYEKREVMIPMRDGVKLYTVMIIPKGAHNAPIVLTRTPYNAAKRAQRTSTPYRDVALAQSDEWLTDDGYIRVFQDIRGKYGSEGDYVMTRPVRGPLNPTNTDETTDAWDTIDWLVKNVPETNGRVGMIGSSYEGFTVVMALLDPHPALKVAAPESPMVDGWMGDDWFHYGAFRQNNLDYITGETTSARRRRGCPARSLRRLRRLPARRFGGRLRESAWAGAISLLAARDAASRLRRVLAGPGARQAGGAASVERAHHVGAGPVGSGRHVGRDP